MKNPIQKRIDLFLEEREKSGTFRSLREVTPISASRCEFRGNVYVNFSSNDYLALSKHPRIVEESLAWTEKFGASSSASRLVCGTIPECVGIEMEIARWKGFEKAIILGSGYLANCGAISALAGRKSAIFADKLNHASLNAGCIQSGADFKRFAHLDYENLGRFLRNSQSEEKLIVSDTVFSMDGDMADIEKLYELSEKYNAILYLDDAHATGVFGSRGEGSSLDFADDKSRIVAMGTFSKGMGAYGAYLAGSEKIIAFFINACQSFIYSTALPPAAYGAIKAGLELVQSAEIRLSAKKLIEKSSRFVSDLRVKGFNCGNTGTQIIPLIFGDSMRVAGISEKLLGDGILAIPIRPPTVPEGGARIRLSFNAGHEDGDIMFLKEKILSLKVD
jgi:8-amino-7-oxononanoate synthase